jgi:DNA repair exonuclease SbcCD ATPase subunit
MITHGLSDDKIASLPDKELDNLKNMTKTFKDQIKNLKTMIKEKEDVIKRRAELDRQKREIEKLDVRIASFREAVVEKIKAGEGARMAINEELDILDLPENHAAEIVEDEDGNYMNRRTYRDIYGYDDPDLADDSPDMEDFDQLIANAERYRNSITGTYITNNPQLNEMLRVIQINRGR